MRLLVKVSFYATLRPVVGAKSVELVLPEGATVADLLDTLLEGYPDLRPHLLGEDGQLSRHVHVFVNGRGAVYLPKRLDTVLALSDVVDIFPAIAGG
jgi:molybdopterin synthase sulfur carrier subunit